MARQMHLSFSAHLTGAHPAGWLHPSTQLDADTDIGAYIGLARLAEQGCFDMFFIADTPAARTTNLTAWARYPMFMNALEPLTALTAIAGATKYIGLGGTCSTSFTEPYNVARQFASLDHISRGRAAWNVVTSANDFAAQNFGHAKLPPHADRYARAREFVEVAKALWDTWEDDAFIHDRAQGLFFDPGKQHAVHHDGPHFKVDGALNIARSPQGRPVIIQAGASDAGKALAAETAEVVFGSAIDIEAGRAFYGDLKGRMAAFGRATDSLKILAGMPVVVGESQQEADDKHAELQAMVHPDVGRQRLSTDLEVDLTQLPLDEPVPEDLIPKTSNFHKAYFDEIVRMIRVEKLTLRQLYTRYERGTRSVRGTPQRVADVLEDWFSTGAADGFMFILHLQPKSLEDIVRYVVPELQRRGLFRTGYTGTTLRDHLGLARPANRHAKAAE
ncbi:LLM class flavin-dependent oxidoreductase [Acidisphaera sp. L21]|uniref:LLM class flavin-dependent oxidoreductase n=1 Tax=Acidisphaera sp. L21 TaxID=1641851 RepID=UPI001C2051D2|nr:LLM class flavin-dependent oxidoreductase [Acidisphaera sp. L21]